MLARRCVGALVDPLARWRVGVLARRHAGARHGWRVHVLACECVGEERRGEEVGRESGLNVIRRQKNAWRQPCASEYRRVHVCWRSGALEVREEAVGSERP